MEKLTCRLKTWSSRHLSYAGKALLINSVLWQMHTFWASVFMLPKGVIVEVAKLCRQFLWGRKENGRIVALVSWEDICRSKKQGGLNLKDPVIWNEAFLGKQVWELAMKKDNLWVKWLHGVYLCRDGIWEANAPSNSSWHWKQLIKVRDKIKTGVQNNRWSQSADGLYTVQLGYRWLHQGGISYRETQFIWNGMSVPKHRFITWLIWKRRLNTRERIKRWNQELQDDTCPLCQTELETQEHVLFTCAYATEIWRKIWMWTKMKSRWIEPRNWRRLLLQWRWSKVKQGIMFAIIQGTFYKLWNERNSMIFKGCRKPEDQVLREIKTETRWRLEISKLKRTQSDRKFVEVLFS